MMQFRFENVRGYTGNFAITTQHSALTGDRKSTVIQLMNALCILRRGGPLYRPEHFARMGGGRPWSAEGLGQRITHTDVFQHYDPSPMAFSFLAANASVMHKRRHAEAPPNKYPRTDGQDAVDVLLRLSPEARHWYSDLLRVEDISVRNGKFSFDGRGSAEMGSTFLYEALFLLWACELYDRSPDGLLLVDDFAPSMDCSDALSLLKKSPVTTVVCSDYIDDVPLLSVWSSRRSDEL
jgi:hypothetical protein